MNKILLLFFVIAALLLSACASGASILTGQARDPLLPEEVKIYPKFPESYEIVGVVTAESNTRLTAQWDADAALKEVKRKAGLMGANGIVISSVTSSSKSFLLSTFLYSRSGRCVNATAIFVEEKSQPNTGIPVSDRL